MRQRGASWVSRLVIGLLVTLLVGCAAPSAPAPSAPSGGGSAPAPAQPEAPRRTKTLNIGISGSVRAMSLAGDATPVGGWLSLLELHSEGLITSDVNSRRPVGRLAERVPSLDDGTMSVLPDNRMRV